MSDVRDDLAEAFDEAGYDVAEVAINRRRVTVGLKDEAVDRDSVVEIFDAVVGEGEYVGLDIGLDQPEGAERFGQVVTARLR